MKIWIPLDRRFLSELFLGEEYNRLKISSSHRASQPSLSACFFFLLFVLFFFFFSSSPSAQIVDSSPPRPPHAPGFNEVVDGGVHLFLLDQVVSPGLLQFHHLAGEGQAGQLHRYRRQEGGTKLAQPTEQHASPLVAQHRETRSFPSRNSIIKSLKQLDDPTRGTP